MRLKKSLAVIRILVFISLASALLIFIGMKLGRNANSEKQNVFSAKSTGDIKSADMSIAALRLQRVKDNVIVPHPKSALILVWSKDCLPCIEELHRYAKYLEAAKPLKLMTLNLDDRKSAQDYLRQLNIPLENALYTDDDPEVVLKELGSRPLVLPYALSLDASGQRCAKHTGLLGMAKVKRWAKQC